MNNTMHQYLVARIASDRYMRKCAAEDSLPPMALSTWNADAAGPGLMDRARAWKDDLGGWLQNNWGKAGLGLLGLLLGSAVGKRLYGNRGALMGALAGGAGGWYGGDKVQGSDWGQRTVQPYIDKLFSKGEHNADI